MDAASLTPSGLAPESRPHAAPRLDFVDCLRGIAILLVFLRHSTEVFILQGTGGRLVYTTAKIFNFGELGVVIFFAISGFLIPSSFSGGKLDGSVRYIFSRVFRLYPAFLLSVIPSAATHFWMGGRAFSWHEIDINCTMLPRLFGIRLANGAYWTLEVEAAFYLLCLLLFIGGILRESFVFAAILLATYCLFETSQMPLFGGLLNPPLLGTSFMFMLNIGVMCWGALARAWWSGERFNPVSAVIFWGFAGSWILYRPAVYAIALLQHRPTGLDTNFLSAYGIGLAVFLAVVAQGGLHITLLRWIGRISYSLYLFHGVVIHAFQHLIERHDWLQGYPSDLYTALALVVALALSQASFTLIERPGIRLGRALCDAVLNLGEVLTPLGHLIATSVPGFITARPRRDRP